MVPPVTRATRRTARAQDVFVHAVEFLAVFAGLDMFAVFGWVVVLEVGFDGLVLLVELGHVWDQVFNDVHYSSTEKSSYATRMYGGKKNNSAQEEVKHVLWGRG